MTSPADSDSGELETKSGGSLILPDFVNLFDQNGNYMSIYNSGTNPNSLACNKLEPDANCMFEVITNTGIYERIKFKGVNERYIVQYYGNDGWFTCDSSSGTIFQVVQANGNQVYLRSINNYFITNRQRTNNYGLAATSYAGSDCLFTISEPIISKEITSVVYDLSRARTTDVSPLIALSTTVRNDSQTSDVQQTLTYSYTRSKVGTWNNAAGIEIGEQVTFSAGVPFISSIDFQIHITASYSHEWGGSVGEEETISSSTQITVPAGKKGMATVIVRKQKIYVPFTCRERILYKDGSTKAKDKNGAYENVESYHVDVQVGDWDDT